MPTELAPLVNLALCAPLILAMVAETLATRRKPAASTPRRWLNTACLWAIDTYLARAVMAGSVLIAALEARQHDWGLVNALALPPVIAFVLGFALIDFTGYLKHRAFHAVPLLWRLHLLHHSDTDMDVATGLRHHPADYVLDGFLTVCVTLLTGAPVEAVLAYQFASLMHNAFRHANVSLPPRMEALLRPILVTPDWHRVHHSAIERETNSNYGVLFPWWDRLLGTECDQPERGHDGMTIGLEYFRDPAENGLLRMLTQPLRARRARALAVTDDRITRERLAADVDPAGTMR